MSRKEALPYFWLPKVDIWIVWRMGSKTRYQAVVQCVEGTRLRGSAHFTEVTMWASHYFMQPSSLIFFL